jgi:thiol-disulfide isomerase/thioredoxin
MRLILIYTALLALASCHKPPQQQPMNGNVPNAANEPHKGVDRSHRGAAALAATFEDADGKPVKLADFAGKPVLVNLWASWCGPCVKELPTLDRLAREGTVQIVAVSQDTGPRASVVAFLQAHRIATLEPYQDPKMALTGALGPDTVLPTSILIDANGKEVWRYIGDQDWTSPEAAKLLVEAGAAPKKT